MTEDSYEKKPDQEPLFDEEQRKVIKNACESWREADPMMFDRIQHSIDRMFMKMGDRLPTVKEGLYEEWIAQELNAGIKDIYVDQKGPQGLDKVFLNLGYAPVLVWQLGEEPLDELLERMDSLYGSTEKGSNYRMVQSTEYPNKFKVYVRFD